MAVPRFQSTHCFDLVIENVELKILSIKYLNGVKVRGHGKDWLNSKYKKHKLYTSKVIILFDNRKYSATNKTKLSLYHLI